MSNVLSNTENPYRRLYIGVFVAALLAALITPRQAHADAETTAAVLVGAALLYAAHDDYKERDKKHKKYYRGRDDHHSRYQYNGKRYKYDDYRRDYRSGGHSHSHPHWSRRDDHRDHNRHGNWYRGDHGKGEHYGNGHKYGHGKKSKHWPSKHSDAKYRHDKHRYDRHRYDQHQESAKWNTRVRAY